MGKGKKKGGPVQDWDNDIDEIQKQNDQGDGKETSKQDAAPATVNIFIIVGIAIRFFMSTIFLKKGRQYFENVDLNTLKQL